MYIFIIDSLVEAHLDCFYSLAVVNRMSVNMAEQIVWHPVGHMPRSDIAALMVDLFLAFWEFYTLLSIVLYQLQSYQQWMNIPLFYIFTSICQLFFLNLATLARVRWTLKVVLFYIFLVTKDVEHFLRYFFKIILLLLNSLFKSITHIQ